jgi:hypothetical protein
MSRTLNFIPLNPVSLSNEGIVEAIPAADPSFDPAGEWEQTYLIVGSRGYQTEHSNVGQLRIRKHSVNENGFSLHIDEQIIGTGRTQGRQEIDAVCSNNAWGTPLKWTRNCYFLNRQGRKVPDLSVVEEGQVLANGNVQIRQNGAVCKTFQLKDSWTSQYHLFEVIQRRSANDASPAAFDLLEDCTLLKPDHTLHRADVMSADLPGLGRQTLQRHVQLGWGILPFDYHVDDHHRVLFAISKNKSYILADPAHAAQIMNERIA